MSAARMTMMTTENIRTEFGWDDDMIHSLLKTPDSTKARRCKSTGGYAHEHYYRERVLAIAQSPEGLDAKRRWDETLRGNRPNPGWTTRLIDIGRPLSITAVAVGKLLELLGHRSGRHVTDSAIAAGCGVRRWDGFAMHDDWHMDRVVSAIRLAAQACGDTTVADALAAAIGRQHGRERMVARKREQDEEEAARRQEEEAVMSALGLELRELRDTDSGMSLLNAVEFITPDPGRRIALYRYCRGDERNFEPNGMGQDGPLRTSSSVDKDLALLERRAMAEGFRFSSKEG
jgi:hypothetical protein